MTTLQLLTKSAGHTVHMKNAFYLLAAKNQLNQFKPLHVVQLCNMLPLNSLVKLN